MIDYLDFDEIDNFDLGGVNIPNCNSAWAGGGGYGGYGGFGGWGRRGVSRDRGGYKGFNSAYFGQGNYSSGWPYYEYDPNLNIPYFFDANEDWDFDFFYD